MATASAEPGVAMREERAQEVRATFRDRFSVAKNAEWMSSYLAAVRQAQTVSEGQFRTPGFQRSLWEVDGVAGIGPGSSVVVTGAYADPEIVEALWQLRILMPPEDPLDRARGLDAEFNRILELVSPRHNARRPSARLARIFAVLRSEDVLCLLDGTRTRHFREWLEQPSYKLGFIGQHVISRQALRETLGPEKSLEDNVSYSLFSWFVWDHILTPADPDAVAPSEISESRATDTPRLTILPAKAQRKGINYLSNNLDLLLSMVRAAENGIDRESLDQQIAEEAPALSRGSRANLMAQAPSLALLSYENGTYRPTAPGRALLEGELPSEVLTPIMVRTVFGFAQILDDLGRAGSLKRGEIAQACKGYYPRWTTDFAPNQLVAWMRDLGLVEIEGVGILAKVSLTETGEYWRSGLPIDVKIPPLLLSNERPDEKTTQGEEEVVITALTPEFRAPPLDKILARFRNNDQLKSLVFSDAQIGLVHAALHSAEGKRFVLLAGLSGTGKTSMAQGYAKAYCEALGLSHQAHYEQVAVWPDWTDPTGLLGFVNPLAIPPTFQETRALRLLLAASTNPDKPYFLCLDEMNLARVEHYFAPFLSAMEGKDGRLAIHSSRDPVDAIPPSITWPTNLFVLGTVNMDETTYPFSDKVLDRAFTFEFWNVDLDGWHAAARARGAHAMLDHVFPVLQAMSTALKPARRHFGYRTCDEVLGFVSASGSDPAAALDAAILAKVLPKIRGDAGGALPQAIADAIAVSASYGLAQTGDKLVQMQATLKELGAVRFWS
jgi:5-methylcytosine-specific restriction protein B